MEYYTTGQAIKYWRTKAGISAFEFGKKIGISADESNIRVRIAQYENDTRTPKLETAKKMAYVLNVSLSELLIEVPIGERIKEARKQKGMTQKELGIMTNIGEATIRKYELGIRKPKLETVSLIALALGYNVGFFYNLYGESESMEQKYIDELKTENLTLKNRIKLLETENEMLNKKIKIFLG